MTKKKKDKQSLPSTDGKKFKLGKWMKIILWILSIVLGFLLIFNIGFKVWVSTWQTYRNDEFGFSFKYPKSWYLGGTDITKKHFEEIGSVFFWVDKEKPEIVQGTTELRRSNGNVVVYISKKSNSSNKLSKSEDYKPAIYGNKSGHEREGIGGITTTGMWMSEKYVGIDLNSNSFGADTLTYTRNNPISILIGKIEHKIGSTILDSFKFD